MDGQAGWLSPLHCTAIQRAGASCVCDCVPIRIGSWIGGVARNLLEAERWMHAGGGGGLAGLVKWGPQSEEMFA